MSLLSGRDKKQQLLRETSLDVLYFFLWTVMSQPQPGSGLQGIFYLFNILSVVSPYPNLVDECF